MADDAMAAALLQLAAHGEWLAVLGDRSPYLYTFKRILMWGRRS